MRVALYARVSSEMQTGTDTPIEGQLRELRDHCERQGWAVAAEYVDRAKSGGSDDREAFPADDRGRQAQVEAVRHDPRLEVLALRAQPGRLAHVQGRPAEALQG